jgi:predicted metal-dependent HD superfamily phosphohydrolase
VGSIPITRSNQRVMLTTNPIRQVNEWEIASIRECDLEAEAATLYSAALPYHNFQHVLTTLAAAEKIIRRCVVEDIRVDWHVVYYALLFHDAGYHEDHQKLGHVSKEAYSAELARDCLARRKILARVIKKVVAAILSTHRDARFVTAEQKAVRAADLSGLAAEYPTFRDNTARLKQEYEMLTGVSMAWSDWAQRVIETVRHYLRQEIRLTSYFVNDHGESAFHVSAEANLRRLQREFIAT